MLPHRMMANTKQVVRAVKKLSHVGQANRTDVLQSWIQRGVAAVPSGVEPPANMSLRHAGP